MPMRTAVLRREAGAEPEQQEDHGQDEERDPEIAGGAEIGRVRAGAADPVDADAHEGDADDGDDRSGHHGREEAQQAADERRDHDAEDAGDDDGAEDDLDAQGRVVGHGEHGESEAKVTPIMTGIRMPTGPTP